MKYKKSLIYIVFSIFLIGLVLTSSSFAQLKIGLINSEIIMQSYSEMVEVQKQITELNQKYRKELEDLNNKFAADMKRFESQSLLLSEEKKKEMQRDLDDLYRRGLAYQQEKFGAGGELERKYQELTDPIVMKVNEAIDKIASDEYFDLVFDVVNMGVLFANPDKTEDITQNVIDELNKGVKIPPAKK